jgi:hypothetical protein
VLLEKNTTLKLLKRGDALKKADKINVDDEKTNRYEKQKERVFNRDISLTPQELTDFLEDAETRQDFNSMGVVFNHPNHTSEHLDTVLNDPRFLATEDVKPEEKYLYRASNKKETVFPAFRTGRFGSSFLRSGKFSDQQIEDLTERMHNNQDHSHTYAIMNYLPENDNLSPHATEKLFDIMSQNSMVKYSDAGRTVFSALGKKLARMPNLSEDTMKKLATHQNPDVRRVLAGNPDATPELIKHLSNDNNKYVAAAARDKQTYHGVAENPQSVVISHGSNKARQVRDWIGAHGGEMHHKELKAAGLDLDSMKMSHLKDGKGYVKADSVQKHIDSLPTSEYHYSIGKYGYDPSENYGAEGHPQRDQYRDLEGDDYDSLPSQEQRHSSETSKVFQLNVTPDHVHKMKQAGVLDTFLKMNNSSVESNHPVSPTHGIG